MDPQKAAMLRGDLYHAFSPVLTAERARCSAACHAFNTQTPSSRVSRINLFHPDASPLQHGSYVILISIIQQPALRDDTPDSELDRYAWVEPPFHADYGYNISLGENVFVNFNCTILDTCKVTIGARTLLGPSVSLYSGTHPLEAEVRNGTAGSELGKEITIGEDCWLGGGVFVLPGVTIGRGSVVGAGSVVTKDVPENSVVAGNPARIVKRLKQGGEKAETEGSKKETVEQLGKRLQRLEKEAMEIKEMLARLEDNEAT